LSRQIYLKLQHVRKWDIGNTPPDVNAMLYINGVSTGVRKYQEFEQETAPGVWQKYYSEVIIIEASFTKPADYGSAVLSDANGNQWPGTVTLAHRIGTVPDNFQIPDDLGGGDNPGPSPQPDDPYVRDYYTYFTSDKSGQIYDQNGVKVRQSGAYQALESAGESLIIEMLDLGPYDDFEQYWPAVDLIDSILSQMPNAQAAAERLRSALKTIKALNGGGRAADPADIAADLNATWWKLQQKLADKLEAHLISLGGFPDDAAARQAVKEAFAGWSLGIEKSSGGRSETVIQHSTNQDIGDFIGYQFDRSAKIVGSIFDDVILLPKGGTAFMGPGDDYFAANYYGEPDYHAATVYGGAGNDTFDASRRGDKLYGEKGNDSIHGADGADTMSGGSGSDTFYYFLASESGVGKGKRDVITDFKRGQDKFYFHPKSDTNSAFVDAHFGGKTKKFDGTVGEIIYHHVNKSGTANDRTFVRMDTDGDRRADFEIELKGLIKLTADDFIL